MVTPPPPEGVAQVPSPRQNVEDDADVPEFKFVTGRLPVTPVERGNPVPLANPIVGFVPKLVRLDEVTPEANAEPVSVPAAAGTVHDPAKAQD
jgi:hypothetical protein